MGRIFQLLVFLKSFATGIVIPVLTLALLEHGSSFSTVSLVLGAYSFTVIAAEFPSGLFADLWGRKKAFLLSAVLYFLSFGIMLFSQSLSLVFGAMIVNGLGRAFSSGSIDALAIDDGMNRGELAKVTAQLSILGSAGLALGALAGGFLSGIGTRYEGNLVANLAIYALLFGLTLAYVREQPQAYHDKTAEEFGRIGAQVRESLSFMRQSGKVSMLFILEFITGFALFAIETYWQPGLVSLASGSWVLGVVSFSGFLCVILGSRLTEGLLMRWPKSDIGLLLGGKMLFGASLTLLAFQFQISFFIGVFALAYLFLGGGSVVENTLLNREAPASRRASILSLFSFVLQMGGLSASLCSYIVSTQSNFRNLWLIAGVMLMVGAGVSALVYRRIRPEMKKIKSTTYSTK